MSATPIPLSLARFLSPSHAKPQVDSWQKIVATALTFNRIRNMVTGHSYTSESGMSIASIPYDYDTVDSPNPFFPASATCTFFLLFFGLLSISAQYPSVSY